MADTSLTVGALAPDFTLAANSGENMTLSAFRGEKSVVLYFYPKADTPGCTVEACGFRDSIDAFRSAGAVVLGVSPDTVKKQNRFVEKFDLPFPLLADVGHAVAETYGVWKEKRFMGRAYMGVERATFVIDKEGVIRSIFHDVKIAGHTGEVLAAIRALSGA